MISKMEMEKLPDFLLTKLNKDYSQEEVIRILEGYKTKRILSFRVNTIKTTAEEIEQELIKNEIKYERVKWSKDAFIVLNKKENEIQEMDIYKNGKIYLQSLSSMLPPIVLNPMPKNDILDMAAAPGGKTTQIAALSNNEANITACEINKIRVERLKYNLDKQGASSVFVMLEDARNIDNFFSFDQILLDSPCSGSGTININENNLNEYFTTELVERSKKLQIALIKKAIKILKSGKEMVYSTCSILKEENEDIIRKVLNEGIEIVPIEFDGKETLPQLSTTIKGTLCICPTKYYEGFFIAKLRKK
ncbi:MAG TPA: Fmu (Sun) domain-containing protein [Clostridiales bacterium]|jgi:NOL1/NOP2/sun family putative RNA methylase|nr:Fmu (Sun) domain-containing protein [Clostridiales bacterium]